MRTIKTLGLETARKYANEGLLDIWGDFTNQRKAHCKVCGDEIQKGEGIGSYFWAMKIPGNRHWIKCKHRGKPNRLSSCICDIRNQNVYVCISCEQKI